PCQQWQGSETAKSLPSSKSSVQSYLHIEMVTKLFRSEILDFQARQGRRAKRFEAVAELR
ncbi:hypothetical protein COU05_01865, partial [bacterium (Candidatus Gribaldobacteria) CG10_big_fil_rev_8_21_14_0_10_37_21]